MIQKIITILYVEDQSASTLFYSNLLDLQPILNVPGMTEFQLGENSILGLMPKSGIKRLLEGKIETADANDSGIKAELYLVVDDASKYLERGKQLGAKVLSEVSLRNWGDIAGYLLDKDSYVIAFAENAK